MKWLNLEISSLRSAEWTGATPAQRGTWLAVAALCADQENGGILPGAAAWTDRQWQQACGVTRREATTSAPLVTVAGADVHVWNYPLEQQNGFARRREAGRKGGLSRASGRPVASSSASSTASSSASSSPSGDAQASLQPKEKERKERVIEKEMEEERKGAADQAPLPPSFSESLDERHLREASRSLPPDFDTPEFRQAWALWHAYLEELRPGRAVPMQTLDAHLRALAHLRAPEAAAALRNSIAKRFSTPVPPFPAKNSAESGAPLYDPSSPNPTLRDVTASP